jgi:hypothetical protein
VADDAPRFTCIREKDGSWTVWDTKLEEPALLGGQMLINRSEPRAEVACSILNRIVAGGLQAVVPGHPSKC